MERQRANYSIHNEIYQDLKAAGGEGWGGEAYPARMLAWDQIIQSLLSRNEFPTPPARILELGSGAGDLALKFAEIGYEVAGVEISPIAVDWATEKAAENLHLMLSLCHRARSEKNSRRSLPCSEKSGVFYLGTMIGDPKPGKVHLKFEPTTRCQIQKGIPYRYMAQKEEVLNELSESGFVIIHQKVTNNFWWDHLSCLCMKRV